MNSGEARPFARYEGGGRRLLGRPRLGDLTARHGYGPPVFDQCGLACSYCGLDVAKPYENWLQLSVDHVVPASAKGIGYPAEWIEGLANLVTCCRPCNEFSNARSRRHHHRTSRRLSRSAIGPSR
jgi:5-methylcytosine-specific restriction endonuclease McrA